MNKKRYWIIQILLSLLVVSGVMVWLFLRNFEVLSYSEGQMTLDNPKRGYYWQVDSANIDEFSDLEDQGFRIVFLAFDIAAFSNSDISKDKLEELTVALQLAEKHHLSVVFRAAYGFEKIPQEPELLEQIGRHVKQIAEVVNSHAENLVCIQAGFLGPYGEWHSGKYLSKEGAPAQNARLYLLEQWESYLDPSIQVALRRPRFIREAMEKGIMNGRLTFHNDALLSTYNDMYTYDDESYTREQELEWVSSELWNQKIGGEMPTLGELSKPEKANDEFQKLHISYLNRSYQQRIFDDWSINTLENQNAEQYIQNHIGYRWYLSTAKVPQQISSVALKYVGLVYELSFVNSGYALLDDGYNLYLVVQRGNEQVVTQIESEQVTVSCNGQSIDFMGRVPLPQNEGDLIKIGLKIALSAQETDEKNCIKLANEGVSIEDGINWIASYNQNTQGAFLLQN